MAMSWQTFHIPLAAGLDTKADARALQPPALTRCQNAVFTEAGGLQKRRPMTALSTDIVGGGSVSDLRQIMAHGEELLLFTATALYSWSEADSAWALRGEYSAPVVSERQVFVRTTEQTLCERAELGGVVFYAWLDATASASTVFLAALDATTRACLYGPTSMGASTTRPRMVALTNKVLLFCAQSSNLVAKALDPTDISTTAGASFTTVSSALNSYYDVAPLGATSAVAAMRDTTTTQYRVHIVTEALAVTSSTKARTCDGPIAISVSPESHVGVARCASTNVRGDLLTSSLTDAYADLALGTASSSPDQITCAFRADGSEYRCYAFWSADETDDAVPAWDCKYNYMDTGGAIGTQAVFVKRLGVASHAFESGGQVHLWLAFAGSSLVAMTTGTLESQLQNTYFLYSDDQTLVAKGAPRIAAGFGALVGFTPSVAATAAGYAFCAGARRIIALGSAQTDYADRGPNEIIVAFDDQGARRTAALGKTVYCTGGQILQYDGEGLAEVGFHIHPWYFDAVDGGSGSLDAGTYTWQSTMRWDNARGEIERSTTAALKQLTLGASKFAALSVAPLHVTRKQGARAAPACELWRTLKDPTLDSPFYLITSKDPTATGTNGYLANDPTLAYFTTFDDDLPDDDLANREQNPENNGSLENLAPPAATIIAGDHRRIYLAGVAGQPDTVWYSKERAEGEIAAFHDGNRVTLPAKGGSISGLGLLNETLIAFKERAIYGLTGTGFDNLGQGQNLSPYVLSHEIGAVNPDAIALTADGLFFLSHKGWYLLDRGQNLVYRGAQVEAYNGDTFVAVLALEDEHQIRCVSTSRVLVYDTVIDQWSEWTISGAKGAALLGGVFHYVTSSAVYREDSAHGGTTGFSLDVETAWIKLADLQGFQRVRQLMVLGEYRSAHDLRIRVARDYVDSYVDDKTWTVTPTTVGGPEQVRHGPSIQKVQAIKVRITDQAVASATAPSGEGLKLTGLALEAGVKRGLQRLPAGRKQ